MHAAHRALVLALVAVPAAAHAAQCPADYDLGTTTGADIAAPLGVTTTCNAGNEWSTSTGDAVSCANGQASPDFSFTWTAPVTGTYLIDTAGSSFDTALQIRSYGPTDCGTTELACDDDDAEGTRSLVQIGVTAGQTILIIADGYSGSSCGTLILNINQDICADDDGDGICNNLDLCFGDDSTGDADGDGICDGIPVGFDVGAAVPGQPLPITVDYGALTGRVYVFASIQGPGLGACLPAAGVCLDVLDQVLIGQRATNATGTASFTPTLPTSLPAHTNLAFQAVVANTATGEGATSSVLVRTTP